MEIVKGEKPRAVRIISGGPAVIEEMLDRLSSEYQPITWNFAVCHDEVTITVVLVSQTQVRLAQIATAALQPNGRR